MVDAHSPAKKTNFLRKVLVLHARADWRALAVTVVRRRSSGAADERMTVHGGAAATGNIVVVIGLLFSCQ